MSTIHSFNDTIPSARYDGTPWIGVRVEEATTATGPWTQIYSAAITPDPTPETPTALDLSVTSSLESGYFRFRFVDAEGLFSPYTAAVASPGEALMGATYTSVWDLRLALAPGGIDTHNATAASLSDDELADAIFEAAQEIDARLGSQYSVPFDPVPGLVAQVTRDLAAYKATLVHRRGNPIAADDPIRLRYAHAMALLLSIAKGDVDLIGADGADVPTATGNAVLVNQYGYDLFSDETLAGLTVYPRT